MSKTNPTLRAETPLHMCVLCVPGGGEGLYLDAEYVFHVFQMDLRELRIRGNTWEYVGIHEGNTEYAHRMAMYSMGIREFLPAPREFSI